jgi:Glycosyltransferase family 92
MKWILFLLIIASPLVADYNLSIAAIFQDEAPYFKEWIDYHKKIGVEHFWLYNNNSTDNYQEVLEPYIQAGTVTLIDWPSPVSQNEEFNHFCFAVQVGAYNHALSLAKGVSKWLALIDIDEFIVPMIEKNLFVFLEKYYSNVSGLCVNWQTYGTSNVKKIKAQDSLLKKLVWKMKWDDPLNTYYKSIVQPLHVYYCESPHYCVYLPNYFPISPNFEKVTGSMTSVNIDLIRLNHYWTRDDWYLQQIKVPRRIKWGFNPIDILKLANSMNAEKDECILRLLD